MPRSHDRDADVLRCPHCNGTGRVIVFDGGAPYHRRGRAPLEAYPEAWGTHVRSCGVCGGDGLLDPADGLLAPYDTWVTDHAVPTT